MSKLESKCMYCGSTSYGSGCIFSAKRIHVHVDDPTRCIYCGMKAYGSGCVYNPFNRMHVHGMDIGQSISEATRNAVESTFIVNKLLESITNTEAFKLKLIDKHGNIIRVPSNTHEQRLISPLNQFINNLKKYLNTSPDSMAASLNLLQASVYNESIEEYEAKLQLQHEATYIIKQLQTLISNNIHSLSLESIENAIKTAILSTLES